MTTAISTTYQAAARTADRNVVRKWARLGIGFNVEPARKTPDLEQLLVATAKVCPRNARLFILVATWLKKFGIYVAAHRIKGLATSQLDSDDQATLAILLGTAVEHGAPKLLRKIVVGELAQATTPGPLFEVDRGPLSDLIEADATETSKHYGRWVQPIELKPGALRTPQWVLKKNPSLSWRAAHKGDLRCSVAETLRRNMLGATISESELARQCGATRAAVRAALHDLQFEFLGLKIIRQQGVRGSMIHLEKTTE